MEDLIVAIDIGTSKVCTVVGSVVNGQVDILGKAISACSGVKKGTIVDIDSTANSIINAVKQVEQEAGLEISSAYVNIAGMHVNVINNKHGIDITNENREVSPLDIKKLMNQVTDINISEDSHIIDVITRQFIIDGCDEITDPTGMSGVRLEVEADIIVGKKVTIQNIFKSMERAGLKIDGFIIEALANSQVALANDEKDMGVILIDIGGGITDISIFKKNNLCYCSSIPVGGDHISNDISVGLKISYLEADKIKKEYELGLTTLITNDQEIKVNDLSENVIKSVKISEVVEITEARIQEIFFLCRRVVEQTGLVIENMGLVLTGAGILPIEGAKQIAQEVFNTSVRLASYKVNEIPKIEYSTAIGMLKYAYTNRRGTKWASSVNIKKRKVKEDKPGLLSKIINFLNSF